VNNYLYCKNCVL